MASAIAKKYYFDNVISTGQGQVFPQELKNQIKETLELNFKSHCRIIGPKPYNLLANIQGIKNRIENEDEDGVIFVVGTPGSGKTTQALICAKYADKTFRNSRTIFTLKELKEFLSKCSNELKKEKEARVEGKIYKSPLKNKAVVLDEGVFMLFSGDAMTKTGKESQKLFSVIRALNLMVFVNVTNFKKINRGVKEDRVILLLRIPRRGIVEVYSKKRIRKIKLFLDNIQWGYPNFIEQTPYIDKNCPFWNEYEVAKAEFLESATE